MRIFWIIYWVIFTIQKVMLPLYFWLLSVTTAPEDTSEFLEESGAMLNSLNGNVALDITLLTIGVLGLIYTFGDGNWRLALHRYASKPRLRRLQDDARRTAEDIANTISQEREREDRERHEEWVSRAKGDLGRRHNYMQQDNRYLSKHMLEAHSVVERLKEAGYWPPDERGFDYNIGVAGATRFAAESTAKSLFAASEKIRCDLEDGFITILTKPQSLQGIESETQL